MLKHWETMDSILLRAGFCGDRVKRVVGKGFRSGRIELKFEEEAGVKVCLVRRLKKPRS